MYKTTAVTHDDIVLIAKNKWFILISVKQGSVLFMMKAG